MKKRKRLFRILLCVAAMLLITIPVSVAAVTTSTIHLGTTPLAIGVNSESAQYVTYADTLWYTLGYNGESKFSSDKRGVVTLHNGDNTGLSAAQFHESSRKYAESDLKVATDKQIECFSPLEMEAIRSRSLTDVDVTGANLWPLSVTEFYSIEPYLAKRHSDGNNIYWLRTPYGNGIAVARAGSVTGAELTYTGGLDWGMQHITQHKIRSAFYLNMGSVVFTSRNKTKESHIGKLTEVKNFDCTYSPRSNTWKLTIADNSRIGFSAKTVYENSEPYIEYQNAAVGENEYISAIVKNAEGNITAYGLLDKVTASSGRIHLDTSAITLDPTDTLYILNEQYNGEGNTDYASSPVDVELPVEGTAALVDCNVMRRAYKEGYLYSFSMNASREISGSFIVALYHQGRLIDIAVEKMSQAGMNYASEKKLIACTDEATSYKIIFIEDFKSLKPICNFAKGEIISEELPHIYTQDFEAEGLTTSEYPINSENNVAYGDSLTYGFNSDRSDIIPIDKVEISEDCSNTGTKSLKLVANRETTRFKLPHLIKTNAKIGDVYNVTLYVKADKPGSISFELMSDADVDTKDEVYYNRTPWANQTFSCEISEDDVATGAFKKYTFSFTVDEDFVKYNINNLAITALCGQTYYLSDEAVFDPVTLYIDDITSEELYE